MPDWTKSMTRTYEYYEVDPNTWKDVKIINCVKSCNINRDWEAETLGSATINIAESVGECYVRVYLVTLQNGIQEKLPLGTYLVQTPSSNFSGKTREATMDCYTPLIELKENPPPLGYSVLKDTNIMDTAYRITRENARAPVVKTTAVNKLFYDFVADPSDTWLSFSSALIGNAKYLYDLDEMGRIIFAPKQNIASLQPVWTFTDDNSSILYPDVTLNHDLFNIPNTVEVVYSNGRDHYYSKVVNDDPNSPTSTVSRGREILKRVTDPDLIGDPTENQIEEYARQLLEELSSVEYTVTFSHGYCPVRIGDCVRLNYTRADLSNIKARIISQSIKCTPDCPVTAKAIFTKKLWG